MTARRILICVHDFAQGGTERVAIHLAKSWSDAGRDVTILCGSVEGGLRTLVDPRVRVVALNPPVRRSLLSRLILGPAMGRQLASLLPDVIFLPGNFHFFLANALRKADPRPAIALKISNPALPMGRAAFVAAPVFRHFTRAVDGFAAMNSGLARDLQALLPGREIVTLHDSVAVGANPSPRSRDGVRQILWIGRLEPQKDVGLALRSLKALTALAPAHLTILGDGALSARTDRMIASWGLGGHVTRLGHVPDIAPHLARADALLITSHYEGGPAVAVEALAQGLPVVSTDCSYLLHDIMTIPEAGRIVASRAPANLAAALLAVSAQRPEAAKLRALVAHFAPQICARAYLDWFDRLTDRRHG